MNPSKPTLVALLSLAAAAALPAPARASPWKDRIEERMQKLTTEVFHNKHKRIVVEHEASGQASDALPVEFNGGPVMVADKRVYLIWYGDWSGEPETVRAVTAFVSSLGDSDYFRTNTIYTDGSGAPISAALTYAGSVNDPYSQGGSLSDRFGFDLGEDLNLLEEDLGMMQADPMSPDILRRIVDRAVDQGLPADENAIYAVLPAADVAGPPAFGPDCAWHGHFTKGVRGGRADLKFAFIGNFNRKEGAGCRDDVPSDSVHGPALDGMISVLAHEINEIVTDPDGDAWYDEQGNETGDKCNFYFGDTMGGPAGEYNVLLGGEPFLIQQNWINDPAYPAGGHCAMALDPSPTVALLP